MTNQPNYTELKEELSEINESLKFPLLIPKIKHRLEKRRQEIIKQLRQMDIEDNGDHDLADLPNGHKLKP